ncbi:hypothetical protein CCH79_00020954, partial [Gambusia affinis]
WSQTHLFPERCAITFHTSTQSAHQSWSTRGSHHQYFNAGVLAYHGALSPDRLQFTPAGSLATGLSSFTSKPTCLPSTQITWNHNKVETSDLLTKTPRQVPHSTMFCMWARQIEPNMTEHSSQQTSPADAIRTTLSEQHTLLQSHETALQELSTRQTETNQRLAELTNFLQNSVPHSPSPEPVSAPEPVQSAQPLFAEIRPPTPERFSDEPETLEELINLTVHLDNRVLSQTREKSRRGSPARTYAAAISIPSVSPPPTSTDPESMQVGRTRLTPEKRRKRITSCLCLYCGSPGHFLAQCPPPDVTIERSPWRSVAANL